MAKQVVNDFSKGSIISNILRLSIPMTLAQLINVLYSIVDRIYIGRMGENSSLALTGVGSRIWRSILPTFRSVVNILMRYAGRE